MAAAGHGAHACAHARAHVHAHASQCPTPPAHALPAGIPRASPSHAAMAVRDLASARAELPTVVQDLGSSAWTRRPSPGRGAAKDHSAVPPVHEVVLATARVPALLYTDSSPPTNLPHHSRASTALLTPSTVECQHY